MADMHALIIFGLVIFGLFVSIFFYKRIAQNAVARWIREKNGTPLNFRKVSFFDSGPFPKPKAFKIEPIYRGSKINVLGVPFVEEVNQILYVHFLWINNSNKTKKSVAKLTLNGIRVIDLKVRKARD